MAAEAIPYDGNQVIRNVRFAKSSASAFDYFDTGIQRMRARLGQPIVPTELIPFTQCLYESSVKDLVPTSPKQYDSLCGRDFVVLAVAVPGAFLPYIFDSPEEKFSIDAACQAAKEVLSGLKKIWFDNYQVGRLQSVTHKIAWILNNYSEQPEILTPFCKAIRSFLHQDKLDDFRAALVILDGTCTPAAIAVHDVVVAFRKVGVLPDELASKLSGERFMALIENKYPGLLI